jgi:hypothetical protein
MRSVLLFAFACAALGQAPPPESLSSLEQEVLKATTDWQVRAKDLDARVGRLLPCDPRAKTAIDDVVKASQDRLTAMGRYYQAAEAQAAARAEGAKRLLAAEEGRAADVAADRLHGEEVTAAVDAALADLAEGARVQPSLGGARTSLQQTAEVARQGLQIAKDQTPRREAALEALRALAAAYQARDAALKEAAAAFDAERTRWTAYYTARSQRAQTECALTGALGDLPPAPAAPKRVPAPPRGKQK